MNCIILYLSSSFTLQTLQCIKCMYVTAKYSQQQNNSQAVGRAYWVISSDAVVLLKSRAGTNRSQKAH